MDAQLKKGLLEICVLRALRERESYGYKIISDLEPTIKISESTLYPILKRWEGEKAVTVRTETHNGRLRKYFKITKLGEEKLADFIAGMEEFQKISDYIVKGGTK